MRRFFRVLDPASFETHFQQWVQSFQLDLTDKVVAIDGKSSRRSTGAAGEMFHMISAFASEAGLVLGQLKVDGKSNEITAIPQLLDMLDIMGATITLDAMGCQTKVVEKIIGRKANYLIGLKGNQGTLDEDVRLLFEEKPDTVRFAMSEEIDKGHGRIERRQCTITEDIQWLKERHPHWEGLRSVIEIKGTREIKGAVTVERRYYISSLGADSAAALSAVRQHWGIENKLHWVLDVCFGDDQSRIRKGNAPANMAIIKKAVLNLLRLMKKEHPRISLKRMRKLAGWDGAFMDAVLRAKF